MGDYVIGVPEIFGLKVRYEYCPGGEAYSRYYEITPREWNDEHGAFMGYELEVEDVPVWEPVSDEEEGEVAYFTPPREVKVVVRWTPVHVIFDGEAFPHKGEPDKMREIVGKETFGKHMRRMKAIATLLEGGSHLSRREER